MHCMSCLQNKVPFQMWAECSTFVNTYAVSGLGVYIAGFGAYTAGLGAYRLWWVKPLDKKMITLL